VKFDFLGLRTLTVIDRAVKIINARRSAAGEALLDISQLPMDDQATYDLMAAAKTTAVFQLESRGMKDLIRRLKPDRFEDIVALVALFRPGPLESGMVGDFIDRKHSRNDPHAPPIDFLHPSLEPVLAPTYGVILYQEQVMQIAQVLASYTLGGADLLPKRARCTLRRR
jgi:DNA polymerase-3 subunit alpha